MCPTIYLTFDCEDIVNGNSTYMLNRILGFLDELDLKGLFFLTGHMAEKVKSRPELLELLKNHEIGYHSSAHSVRPIIVEYTDIDDYDRARELSLERETSHIDPITGECKGEGGLLVLRGLFPTKRIVAYRAPGFSWSPPHLDALEKLGIEFDFSTDLSPNPVRYKSLTFYPSPSIFDVIGPLKYRTILKSLARARIAVIGFHPHFFANAEPWDLIYFRGNPVKLSQVKQRSWNETKPLLRRFELFLKRLDHLRKKGILQIAPILKNGEKMQCFTMKNISKNYWESISWATSNFGCNPKFIRKHHQRFFDLEHGSRS